MNAMKITARHGRWHRPVWWHRTLSGTLGLAVALTCGSAAFGQVPEQPPKPGEDNTPTARTNPNDPMGWNVEAMMEEAVLQISRRYNLNKAQEEYTRLLLTRRAKEFLKLYEDDVRTLLKENVDFRIGLKPGTKEALMDWAQRAGPVFNAAKEAILDGNKEWREILTEEQRKTHDADLTQMNSNFKNLEVALDSWKKGTGPSLGPIQQTSTQAGNAGQSTGLVSQNAVSRNVLLEDNWKAYVDKFIQIYKFDEKQQNAALSGIHKETLGQAKKYREKRQGDFESIESQLAVLAKDPKASDRREMLQRQKVKLEEPLRTMFVHLDERLKTLPRDDQRAGAEAAQMQVLQVMFDELSGKRLKELPGSGTRTRVSTQPASTQPASTQAATTQPATTQPSAGQPAAVKPVAPAAPQSQPAAPPAVAPALKGPAAPTGEKPKIPDPAKAQESKRSGE
jgi:hypothetical protein